MANMSMRDALRRNVVAVDSAEEMGQIKSFVVDSAGRTITKVHISGRNKKAELLAWAAIEFGPDFVMATSASRVEEVQDDRELEAVKGNIELLGALILDTDGFEHGTVDDVEFETSDGSIVRLHGDIEIEAARVRSLGSYAVVIDASE